MKIKMNRILATMTVAALAAWATPASALVLFTDPGGTVSQSSPFLNVSGDVTSFINVKLSFKTDGTGGIDPCGSGFKSDCLSVYVNGNPISGLQDLSVPNPLTSFGPTVLGADDQTITLSFEGMFSCSCESFVISNIKLTSYQLLTPSGIQYIPEPTPFAMFGLGLAGLGYIRRRRSI